MIENDDGGPFCTASPPFWGELKKQETNQMFTLKPIGYVSSPLVDREHAPKQGYEGVSEAWLVFKPEFQEGLTDLRAGEEILVQ
jgi:hypothetical protein